jgi:hypothetical protein
MWFVALGNINSATWVANMMNRLYYNSPAVLTLFESNPFDEKPPDYLRV